MSNIAMSRTPQRLNFASVGRQSCMILEAYPDLVSPGPNSPKLFLLKGKNGIFFVIY